MYRRIPNACTKRNLARFGRYGPPAFGCRWGPGPPQHMEHWKSSYVDLDQLENILSIITRKEKRND